MRRKMLLSLISATDRDSSVYEDVCAHTMSCTSYRREYQSLSIQHGGMSRREEEGRARMRERRREEDDETNDCDDDSDDDAATLHPDSRTTKC